MDYHKWSEWRKWDLHIHTPFSILNNNFGTDFDKYVQELFKNAISKGIAVIWITDYFLIEWYKKLKNEYVNNNKKLKDLKFSDDEIEQIKSIILLPNIEFRLDKLVWSSRVNYHIIFSELISPEEIEDNFLSSLTFKFDWTTGSDCETKILNKNNLVEFWKKIKKDQTSFNSKTDLQVWLECATINDEDIIKILNNKKSIFHWKYVIALPLDEDLPELSWNWQDHMERKTLIKKAHLFITSNPKTIKWASWCVPMNNKEEYIKEFGWLKPCIWWSDAHWYANLFEPDKKRYCWVKADPTFEWLKQIIYEPEPEDRVYIWEMPELLQRVNDNKTKYIDKLSINQIQWYGEENWVWFKDVSIDFNKGLVAIIWNKWSWKSALSDILWLLWDTKNAGLNQCNLSFLNNEPNKKRFRQDWFADNFESTLFWEDKSSITAKLKDDINQNKVEKIKYLPQNYFEALTNELGAEKLKKTFEDVIFFHVPEEAKLKKANFEELVEFKKNSIDTNINKLRVQIGNLSNKIIDLEKKKHPDYMEKLKSNIDEKRKELNSLGDKPKEIKKQLTKDSLLHKKMNKLDKLNQDYISKWIDIENQQRKLNTLTIEKERLNQIKVEIEEIESEINDFRERNKDELNNQKIKIEEIILCSFNKTLLNKKIESKNTEIEEIKKNLFSKDQIDWLDVDSISKEVLLKKSEVVKYNNIKQEIDKIKNELWEPERKYQEYIEQLQKWENKKRLVEWDEKTHNTLNYFLNEELFIEKDLQNKLNTLREDRLSLSLEILKSKEEILSIYNLLKETIDKEILKEWELSKNFKINMDAVFRIKPSFYKDFIWYIQKNKTWTFIQVTETSPILQSIFEKISIFWNNEWEKIKIALEKVIMFLEKDQKSDKKLEISNQIKDTDLERFYDFLFSLDYIEPTYELKLDGKWINQLSPWEKGALLLVFYLMLDKDSIPLVIDQPEDNLDNKSVYQILTHYIKVAKKRRQIIIVTHNPNLAVGADAEQIIYVELDKASNNEFKYETWSIENPLINKRIVEILEWTQPAFDKRKLKYFA